MTTLPPFFILFSLVTLLGQWGALVDWLVIIVLSKKYIYIHIFLNLYFSIEFSYNTNTRNTTLCFDSLTIFQFAGAFRWENSLEAIRRGK